MYSYHAQAWMFDRGNRYCSMSCEFEKTKCEYRENHQYYMVVTVLSSKNIAEFIKVQGDFHFGINIGDRIINAY